MLKVMGEGRGPVNHVQGHGREVRGLIHVQGDVR